MKKEILFNGTFKTVKAGEGKEAVYKISLIQKEGEGDAAKDIETPIGENAKLIGAKNHVKAYVAEKDPKATHFVIIHHKPGREKDARETLTTKAI